MDVLMLDVARVLRKSSAGRFDTVVFFDLNRESVLETTQRIKGGIRLSADFFKLVNLEGPDEDAILDASPLESPPDQPDDAPVRQRQVRLAERQRFIRFFPFDVMNIDIEQLLFPVGEDIPGKVMSAFRKLFKWQTRDLARESGQPLPLTGFSLMFTTRNGPTNLTDQ